METIGQLIAKARLSKRWKQEKLASELGIKQSIISNIENDRLSPKWDLLVKIAQKLGVLLISILPLSDITDNNIQNQSAEVISLLQVYEEKEKVLLEALLKAEAKVMAVKDQYIQLLREKNDG